MQAGGAGLQDRSRFDLLMGQCLIERAHAGCWNARFIEKDFPFIGAPFCNVLGDKCRVAVPSKSDFAAGHPQHLFCTPIFAECFEQSRQLPVGEGSDHQQTVLRLERSVTWIVWMNIAMRLRRRT